MAARVLETLGADSAKIRTQVLVLHCWCLQAQWGGGDELGELALGCVVGRRREQPMLLSVQLQFDVWGVGVSWGEDNC